jgi:uncharacterized protein (TIGR03435 family)
VFDIDAKVDDSLAQSDDKWPEQVRPMVQSLLADRFQLKVRRETMERPAYALVLDKNGPKFAADPHPEKGGVHGLGPGKLQFISSRLSDLAWVLTLRPELGRRLVLDKTGLEGNYSFTFQWTPDSSSVSIFTALEQQLGLKLEPTTAPMDTLVIEHIEPPLEN